MTKCLVNHMAFDVVTNDAAYWIGFLFADGSVIQQQKGAPVLQLRLSEIDRGQVENFRNSSDPRMQLLLVRQVTSVDIDQGPRFVLH